MPKSVSHLLKVVIVIAGLVCLAFTVERSANEAVALPRPNWGWLLLAAVLFLLHYFVQAAGWHGILRALGQPVSPRLSMRMWYMSLIARWMPGRIWYSASRIYLAREAGISLTAVTFAIVLELIYILIGGLLATLMFAGSLLKGLVASAQGQSTFAVGILLLFGCGAVALRPGTLLWMCRFALFRKAVKRLTGEVLTEENMPTMNAGRSMALLAYYTLFWIGSGIMFGVLASAFIPMDSGRWLACIPAFAGSWLIGFFSVVTPAGLGVREGAIWFMLKPVMPQLSAMTLAISSRLMMLATELLSVAVMVLILREKVSLPRPSASLDSAGHEQAAAEAAV